MVDDVIISMSSLVNGVSQGHDSGGEIPAEQIKQQKWQAESSCHQKSISQSGVENSGLGSSIKGNDVHRVRGTVRNQRGDSTDGMRSV